MDLSEQILAAQDLPREPVPCPEWGADPADPAGPLTLYVRKASSAELEAWDESNVRRTPDGRRVETVRVGSAARLVVKVTEDRAGNRVFQDNQAARLAGKNGAVLERLAAVALRLVGRLEDDAKKNSPPTPEGASSTASP